MKTLPTKLDSAQLVSQKKVKLPKMRENNQHKSAFSGFSSSSALSSAFSSHQIFRYNSSTLELRDSDNFVGGNCKRRIFILLHRPQEFDCIYHLLLLILITINCVMFNVRQTTNISAPQYPKHVYESIHKAMLTFDMIIGIIFIIELSVRIYTASHMPKYKGIAGMYHYFSEYYLQRVLDCFAIATCFSYFIYNMWPNKSDFHSFIDSTFRLIHLGQLLQVYRLLGKLWFTIKEAVVEQTLQLMLALLAILFSLLWCSLPLFLIEGPSKDLESTSDSFWLSFVTFSTIGYGDMKPSTPSGRLFLCLSALVGVVFFHLPSSVIGNSFAYRLREQRRLSYRYFETAKLVRTALVHHQHGALQKEHMQGQSSYRPANLLTRQIANELKRGRTTISMNKCRTRLNYRRLKSRFDLDETEDSVEDVWTRLLHIDDGQQYKLETKSKQQLQANSKRFISQEASFVESKSISTLSSENNILDRYATLNSKNPSSDNQMLMFCINLIEDGVADITTSVAELAEQVKVIESLALNQKSSMLPSESISTTMTTADVPSRNRSTNQTHKT